MDHVRVSVTSCLGGKQETYAIQVIQDQQKLSYVYRRASEFHDLWKDIRACVNEHLVSTCPYKKADRKCVVGHWLAGFSERFPLETVFNALRAQNKNTMPLFDMFLQTVLERISTLFVVTDTLCAQEEEVVILIQQFLELGCKDQAHTVKLPKRKCVQHCSVLSVIPKRCAESTSHIYPTTYFPPSKRPCMKPIDRFTINTKCEGVTIAACGATRRRVFAEVDF